MTRELPDKPVVCASTVHRLLKRQLITLKKINDILAERNQDDVKHAHRIHCKWLQGFIFGWLAQEAVLLKDRVPFASSVDDGDQILQSYWLFPTSEVFIIK